MCGAVELKRELLRQGGVVEVMGLRKAGRLRDQLRMIPNGLNGLID